MKNTQVANISQQINKKNYNSFIFPVIEFQENPIKSLSEMTKAEFKLLCLLVAHAHRPDIIRKAHQTFARYLGVCRRTIIRVYQKLEALGLVTSRGFLYEVRRYMISEYFLDPVIRKLLGVWIPALNLQIYKNVTPSKPLRFLSRNLDQDLDLDSHTTKRIVTKQEIWDPDSRNKIKIPDFYQKIEENLGISQEVLCVLRKMERHGC